MANKKADEIVKRHREKMQRDNARMRKLVERVSNLNRDAGEIGAGMLASLVDEARAILADPEGGKL